MRSAAGPIRAAIAIAATLGLAGCGQTESPTETPEQQSEADPSAFPVEIEHKLGTTEIPESPERVVTVGLRDQDFTLALGVTPVGTTEWFGEQPGAIWPWARDSVSGAEPEIVGANQELNFEAINRLDPDLILGVYSGMTERTYESLSQIAPTVADPPDQADYTVSWQEQAAITGEALGREEAAAASVEAIETRIDEIVAAHPEWEGLEVAYGGLDGTPGVYTSFDQRGRLLEALSFEVPEEIDERAVTPEGFLTEFSPEEFRILDRDLVIIGGQTGDPAELPEIDPLYGQLDAYDEGRVIAIDENLGTLSGAVSFASPLSLDYALDELEPRIEAAVDADPETEIEPTPRLED